MTPIERFLRALVTLALVLVATAGSAHAQELSQPVTLVASEDLDGTPFAQTVVIATPTPVGGHIGFIVNRPTDVKLETLFPDTPSTRTVADPVYLGGPRHTDSLFVLAPAAPAGSTNVIALLPGLVAILDEDAIDLVLEQSPNDARYFIGMFLWAPGELATQVKAGIWTVKPADATVAFRKQASQLWSELRATSVRGGKSGTWL